jgi:hypothetical protein
MSAAAHLLMAAAVAPLTVTLSQGTIQSANTNSQTQFNFGNNIATGAGGAGAYTYAWSMSGQINQGNWTLSSTTGPITTASVTNVGPNQQGEVNVTCTVTDHMGKTAAATTRYAYANIPYS